MTWITAPLFSFANPDGTAPSKCGNSCRIASAGPSSLVRTGLRIAEGSPGGLFGRRRILVGQKFIAIRVAFTSIGRIHPPIAPQIVHALMDTFQMAKIAVPKGIVRGNPAADRQAATTTGASDGWLNLSRARNSAPPCYTPMWNGPRGTVCRLSAPRLVMCTSSPVCTPAV